jgi:hypothetical protein
MRLVFLAIVIEGGRSMGAGFRTLALVIVGVALAGPTRSLADKLPQNATPMTSDEVTTLYSGNSAIWSNSKAFFAPDHKVKGVFGKGKDRITYSGEWSVKDNELCVSNTAKGDPKVYTDCWKWWRAEDKTLTLWSVHYDGSKADLDDGYYDDEAEKIKQGDQVTKEFEELGGT